MAARTSLDHRIGCPQPSADRSKARQQKFAADSPLEGAAGGLGAPGGQARPAARSCSTALLPDRDRLDRYNPQSRLRAWDRAWKRQSWKSSLTCPARSHRISRCTRETRVRYPWEAVRADQPSAPSGSSA